MKLKEGFILRDIAGEHVVISSGEELDLNMMITLNDTGCTLWKALEKGGDEAELAAALMAEYEVDEKTAAASVKRFTDKLRQNDFLE